MCGVLDALDGLLLTGSPSNVHPSEYGDEPLDAEILHDPERDATTLPLIREAVRRDLPVLAICRGIQELNVALGGTLHQRVHEVPGRLNHRYRKESPDGAYGPAHPVTLTAGGMLAGLAGSLEVMVNSLHSQGIDRPAPRLRVEAVAPDGQIEGSEPARSAIRRRRAVASRVSRRWKTRSRRPCSPPLRGACHAAAAGVTDGQFTRRERARVGSAALHAFFLFRACTKWGLFSLERIPFSVSRSGESMTLSQKRSRLPYGTDFPQTLLTCRRPVYPPRPGAVVFCGPVFRRLPGDEPPACYLEHQLGAAAHRQCLPTDRRMGARRPVPAGNQDPGRAVPARAIEALGYRHSWCTA